MQLPVYTPQVQKTSGGDAKVVVPSNYGAAGQLAAQGMNALGKGLGAVNAALFKQAADADKTTATAANNEYTQRLNDLMYNDKDGLMHTQMQGADGITSVFEEKEKQIREEVAKKYKYNFNAGRQEFDTMANRTYGQRMTNVQNHMFQESKKYRNVTFTNAIDNQARFAADNYADAAMVEDAISAAIGHVDNYYAGQGEEVLLQQRRKVTGQIAQQVIERAYANGDMDTAEANIERYGRYMDPNVLTGYAKNLYQNRMSAATEVTAKSLFAKFGDNAEAVYNYINSEEFAGNGNVDGALKWFEDATARGESLGANQCTVGLNKALVAGGFKPIHTWGPTAWEELKNAGRTFTDRSKLRHGDIVCWDSMGDGDTSHVGMYDAKTGKVYQSGNSGIRPISLDEYKIIGFAHPQGKAATPEERKRLFAAYQQELSLHKQFEAQENQRIADSVQQKLFDLQRNGETDPAVFQNVIAQAVGSNAKLAAKLMPMAKSYAGVGAKASGAKASSALDPMLEPTIINMMTREGYSNEDIIEFVNKNKDNPNSPILFNERGCAKVLDLMQDRINGTGAFKYDWDGMENAVMAGYRGNATMKDFAWSNIKAQTIYDIDDYRTTNRREPTRDEVLSMARQKLTGYSYTAPSAILGTTTKSIDRYELAAKGIYHISRNENGMNDIVIKVGNQWARRRISDADIAKIRSGEDVLNLTNESAYTR